MLKQEAMTALVLVQTGHPVGMVKGGMEDQAQGVGMGIRMGWASPETHVRVCVRVNLLQAVRFSELGLMNEAFGEGGE